MLLKICIHLSNELFVTRFRSAAHRTIALDACKQKQTLFRSKNFTANFVIQSKLKNKTSKNLRFELVFNVSCFTTTDQFYCSVGCELTNSCSIIRKNSPNQHAVNRVCREKKVGTANFTD